MAFFAVFSAVVISADASMSCTDTKNCAKTTQEDLLLQAKFNVHVADEAYLGTGVAEKEEANDHEAMWGGEVSGHRWNHIKEYTNEMHEEEAWHEKAALLHADKYAETETQHLDDWMYETTLDNEWIAGGGPSDTEFNKLSKDEKHVFTKEAHRVADEILEEGGEEAKHEREVWVEQFHTEHQHVVRELKRWPHLATVSQLPCGRYEGAGGISGLYTFGAPGTALAALTNVLSEDGKFPGLRLVTQRIRRVWGDVLRTYHDPVPFVAGIVGMQHPQMDLLILPVGYHPEFHETSDEVVKIPRSDMAFWIQGHFQPVYYRELEPHYHKYDPKAFTMLHMSKGVTPGNNNNSIVGNAAWAAKVGWNLVAQSKNEKLGKTDIIFQDNTSLYQDPDTMACTLSFVGTHDITHWLVNLRFRPASFCGIPNVHIGFRNQVRRVIRSKLWSRDMQPAMASCRELYLTGHSLGAAQAQLVAACMQRAPAEGEPGWEDYRYLVWTPSEEAANILPSVVSAEELAAFGSN